METFFFFSASDIGILGKRTSGFSQQDSNLPTNILHTTRIGMPMSDICKRNMMICFGQLMINAFFSVSDRKRKIRVNLTCSVLYWYCTGARMYSHTLSQGKMIYHGQIQFSRHHPRQKLLRFHFLLEESV